MSALLVDTSAYSASLRNHVEVVRMLRDAPIIHFSPVVIGELMSGFRRGKYRRKNEEELEEFLRSDRVQVPQLDRDTSDRYAEIHASLLQAGTPLPTNDIWIAASAMQHGSTILTTDTHFQKIPQVIVRCYQVM